MSASIRIATEADNESLLALTRLTPMAGTIALRIDRDPDFFALLRHRGENAAVFVAEKDGAIIGCVSVAFLQTYVAGAVQPVAYVADLKVHPAHAGTRLVLRLLEMLRWHIEAHGVDLVFSVAAAGNEHVMPLFAGRAGISRFVSAGRFIVDELFGSPFFSTRSTIGEATNAEREEIDRLLDDFHRSRELAPVTRQTGEGIATLVAREASRIVATLDLFDPTPLKRNVLLGAPPVTRLLLRLLRPLGEMPRLGEAVRLAYIRRFACAPGHVHALMALVHHARRVAKRHHFTFTAIGLHERDPLRQIVLGIPRFSFTSCAFVTSLGGSKVVDQIANGIPFVDFGSV